MNRKSVPKLKRDGFQNKKSISSSQDEKITNELLWLLRELSFLPQEHIDILISCQRASNVDVCEFTSRFIDLLHKYHGVSKRVVTQWALQDFVAAELERLGLLSPAAKEALQR